MNESRRAGGSEELARTLLATARSAATAAVRAGLEDIEERHGQHVADEVAGLIDVAEVYAGLADHDVRPRGRADRRDRDNRDDGPWEFKPVSAV
ncbi:hypothetical protein OHS58_08275 [Amycolatopsis sp. NBC_00348]|uniref:hypothetical protein n=1 Tax=Amycolatopsis sp. NBC_00348 TaxID=2975956 RepID=UPI002E25BEBC